MSPRADFRIFLFPENWKIEIGSKENRKEDFPVGKIHQIELFSAAYSKMLFSLLNSNQRENLILKNRYALIDHNIVIILTNVD